MAFIRKEVSQLRTVDKRLIVQGLGPLISRTSYFQANWRHIEPPIGGFSSSADTVRYFQTESLAVPGLIAQVRVTVRLKVSVNPASPFITMRNLAPLCYKFSNINMPHR